MTSRMTSDPAPPDDESDPRYTFRPSLLGAPREFRLTGQGIVWTAGRHSGRVPYGAVRRVRLSFRPVSMQSHRFMTEIWADGAPKLEIVSSSWRSMVEQERLDGPYAVFVAELHKRLAQSGAAVRWEQGVSPLVYWPRLALFVAIALGLAALAVIGLRAKALGGAAFVAAFLALCLWQGGNYFRRNRSRAYRPERLPAAVMPKG